MNTIAIELRKSGISVIGEVPWGTRFCHFYETKQDLLDTLVPYFKAGLESKEFCLWVVSDSELITVEEAKGALAQAVPDLDRHLAAGNIEILDALDWYLEKNVLNLEKVTRAWDAKLKRALALGYEGMRVSGDTFWLREKDWKDFCAYEKQLNDSITGQYMTVLCTYPLAKSGAAEVLDVVQTHQFATARRQGEWKLIETPDLIQARTEIRRLNEELEQRVVERTGQLAKAIKELTDEISDRKQSEVELSLVHQRLSYHVENTPLAVIEWDKDLFIKRWSKRAEEVFGWKASEALGINMYDPDFPIVYEEDAHAVEEIAGQLIKGTVNRNLSLNRNYTKDGNVIYCEWYNSVLRDEDGNVITILSLVHDVTERKRAEDALRRSEDRIRLIIDTIPTMAWTVEPDDDIDFVNQRWLDYAGLSLEEAIERPACAVHPEDLSRVREKWLTTMAAEEPYEDELRLRRADGEYRWFLVRTAPLRDEQGNLVKWYGVSIDIEDRKQAEEALDERLRFETLVTELSAAFANLSPNEVDKEIDKWLQSLVEFLGVDRASFFQFGEDWTTLYRSHSYTVPGIEPLPPSPIGIKEQFPWMTDQLRRGVTVKWSRIPDDMPEEAAKEKEYAARLGVKSGLNIPVLMGGSVICAITFTSIVSYRDWPDAMVARLRLVGEIFAAAVERKRAEAALRAAEQKYREIFEKAGEGIFQSTPDGRYIAANPTLARMYGFASPEELIHSRQDISRQVYVDPDRREEFKRRLDEQGAVRGFEHEVFRKDGTTLWISVNARAVRDEQGAIQYYEGTAQDIADRKRAEEALRESEERYRELFENAKDATFVHDLSGRYTSVNRAAEKLIGYARAEMLGKEVIHFFPPEQIEHIRECSRKLVDEGETAYESEVVTKDGRRVPVDIESHLIFENGVPVGVQGTARDITERKAAEEKLKANSEQLRALSARLQSAREEEGTRIAREIHDELGSALTSLKWDLEEMGKILSTSGGQSETAVLREKLHAPMKLADTAISAIRRIASELRPSVLDDLGLVAAIEWQAQQFQARTGIVCVCECLLEKLELSEEQSTAIFRILQETLTNVLRHTQATRVDIKINKENGYFVLSISDNGKGITNSEKSEQRSLGILGMRERTHLIGGELDIKGVEGKGTVVIVRVPLSAQDRVLKMTR